MSKNNKEMNKNIKTTNKITLKVHDVEKNSVIVNVDGWRIRLYTDKKYSIGQTVKASYTGNLKDIHSVKFLPLK